MSRAVAVLALGLAGCSTSGLSTSFLADEALRWDKARYPDDAAVVLYRADKTRLDTQGEPFTAFMRHTVMAIQSEGGFDLAEVRVPYNAKASLVDFRARVVQPDGSVQVLDAKSLMSDTNGAGERDSNAHFFRFPDVRVGSVLEYAYVVEAPGIWTQDDQDTLGHFPVREYEFELTASKPLVLETIELNSRSPIEVRTRPNGDHQLYFALHDLPPRDAEPYAPDWTFTEPRWAWRVVAYKAGTITYDWLRDWKDVVEPRGKAFFVDSKLYDGFDAKADFSGCADVACKVARAQDVVRGRTASNVKWSREQPLAQAFASGRASVTERALMLKKLLEDGGVDVWLAYGTDKASQERTPTFPLWSQFDHLFVYLPAQPGLDSPMTIDPHCEFCAPGTLTARHSGIPIYVFKTRAVLGGEDTEGRWTTAWAEPPKPASGTLVTHHARVQADGSVEDAVSFEATGYEAMLHAQSPPLGAKVAREALEAARRLSPVASVSESSFGPCEAAKGSCRWSAKRTLPVTAVADGARWLVATSLLEPQADTLFDEAQRKQDVHFRGDDYTFREVLEVEAPPGYRLATAGPPVTVSCDAMAATVVVEPTATGARLTRTLTQRVGEWPKASYPDLQKVAAAFKQARHQLLVFEKR